MCTATAGAILRPAMPEIRGIPYAKLRIFMLHLRADIPGVGAQPAHREEEILQ
jgi:hypothetical protein